MKIFVTGASGFIGYHLSRKLLEVGYEVIGFDSINDYYDPSLKYARLKELGIEKVDDSCKSYSSKFENFIFVKGRLEDKLLLDELFKSYSFSCVINLAAQAGVRYSLENPLEYISSNVQGFCNILECSKQYSIKHLIFASSSSVYGQRADELFSADMPVDHPVSLYAATKRSNELMAHVYSHLYNLPVTGLRFFTVYGPWGRPDMAPMLFTKAILEGKQISVFNDGLLSRDFTYIDDIVTGIVKLIDVVPQKLGKDSIVSPANSYIAPFTIYNIGNNSPVKLLRFIETLELELGIRANKLMLPMQPGDVYSTCADVNPLTSVTGYKPNTELEDGVRNFIHWYRSFYK